MHFPFSLYLFFQFYLFPRLQQRHFDFDSASKPFDKESRCAKEIDFSLTQYLSFQQQYHL